MGALMGYGVILLLCLFAFLIQYNPTIRKWSDNW